MLDYFLETRYVPMYCVICVKASDGHTVGFNYFWGSILKHSFLQNNMKTIATKATFLLQLRHTFCDTYALCTNKRRSVFCDKRQKANKGKKLLGVNKHQSLNHSKSSFE